MSHPTATWTLTTIDADAQAASVKSNFLPGVDLALDANGDLEVGTDLRFTRGLEAVAQGVKLRVRLFQGEWFLDLDNGVPYWQDILGKKFDEIKIRSAFRNAILDAPGAEELAEMEVDFSAATRLLQVSWTVATGLEGDEITDKIDFGV